MILQLVQIFVASPDHKLRMQKPLSDFVAASATGGATAGDGTAGDGTAKP